MRSFIPSDSSRGPKSIAGFLDVYRKKIKAPQNSVIVEFVSVVKEVTFVKVNVSDCDYNPKTRTLYVKTSSVIKQDLLLRSPEILSRLEDKIGVSNSPHSII